jgi:hypothetical protein
MNPQRAELILASVKGWVVLASVAVAIYVVAGSWMFGDWWYGFFWGGKRKLRDIRNALGVLLDQRFPLTIGIVAAFFVTVVVCLVLQRWLFWVTDRFGWLILFAAVMAIVAEALVIYNRYKGPYARAMTAMATFIQALDEFQKEEAASTMPKIQPPICFHYLDNDRVEGLYSQIQPGLEEKERTVEGSTSVRAEVKAGLPGTNVDVEAGKARASKSTYARSEFSIDRKCVEVMRHVSETCPANYYSSEVDWYFRRVCQSTLRPAFDRLYKLVSGIPAESANAKGVRQQAEREAGQLQAELKSELESLQGLVFVDGEFDMAIQGESATLIKKFSSHPLRSSFRILLPKNALQAMATTRPLQLRVFGAVRKPLGDDGFVDIAAIAAY